MIKLVNSDIFLLILNMSDILNNQADNQVSQLKRCGNEIKIN